MSPARKRIAVLLVAVATAFGCLSTPDFQLLEENGGTSSIDPGIVEPGAEASQPSDTLPDEDEDEDAGEVEDEMDAGDSGIRDARADVRDARVDANPADATTTPQCIAAGKACRTDAGKKCCSGRCRLGLNKKLVCALL